MRQILALLMLCLSLGQNSTEILVDQTSLGGNLYLVNRVYRLTENYKPDDLVRPDVRKTSSEIMMRREAAGHLEELFKHAYAEGHTLVAVSGFRSYETQRLIYQRKISTTGSRQKAELLVAPPGTSEHQLGLAMDIGRKSSTNLNASFGRSEEGLWLSENADRFGFIIRYKAEWTDITGYADEPWHIRYVGVDHAAVIKKRAIPFEQYVGELAQLMFGEFLGNATY